MTDWRRLENARNCLAFYLRRLNDKTITNYERRCFRDLADYFNRVIIELENKKDKA